jgi:hypothetical protein
LPIALSDAVNSAIISPLSFIECIGYITLAVIRLYRLQLLDIQSGVH